MVPCASPHARSQGVKSHVTPALSAVSRFMIRLDEMFRLLPFTLSRISQAWIQHPLSQKNFWEDFAALDVTVD